MSIEPAGSAIGPTSTVSVPAELRFVEVVRRAVRVALDDSGCDSGCMRDLQLATDELASILITSTDHPSQLQVAVTDDETDVYVRMLVPVARGGFDPHVAELAWLLLDAAVESYEVGLDGDQLLGVLQRALIDDQRRAGQPQECANAARSSKEAGEVRVCPKGVDWRFDVFAVDEPAVVAVVDQWFDMFDVDDCPSTSEDDQRSPLASALRELSSLQDRFARARRSRAAAVIAIAD